MHCQQVELFSSYDCYAQILPDEIKKLQRWDERRLWLPEAIRKASAKLGLEGAWRKDLQTRHTSTLSTHREGRQGCRAQDCSTEERARAVSRMIIEMGGDVDERTCKIALTGLRSSCEMTEIRNSCCLLEPTEE